MGTMLRATIVGINEYKDEKYRHKARLSFASSDAKEITDLLESSTVFTAEKVTLLMDKDATRVKVRDSLKATFTRRSFDSNTIALFYFAGHGIANPNDNRISLCCHDVDFADPEAGGIRLNDIYDLLASCSAECVIAIIDACFSGGIVIGHIGHMSAAEQAMQAIEMLHYPEGKTGAIFAACGSDEASRERKSLGHGIFTYELLRGWRYGEAREKNDGIVYLLGLANFLTQDLTKYVQQPQITFRVSRPIALWKMEQTTVNVSPSPLAPPPPASRVIPVSGPSKSGMIIERFKMPTADGPQPNNLQDRNRLFVVLLSVLTLGLLVLSLIIFFIIHLFIH